MRSRTERLTNIENSLRNPKGQKKVPWRGGDDYFPVINIHSDMLMYRLENSRTSRQQQAYVRQHDLPINYFENQESPEVQIAQESILLKMAKSQPGFIDDLKQRKQKDELIITRDGYIVNGNRRTSALKDLGENYFNCAVLPDDTTAKDIYALEQELQISTDFRMEYDWINELNNIRKGLQDPVYGFTEKELAKNLRISPQALKGKLKTIALIDQFLEWNNQSGNYAYQKLDKLRQAFDDLEKGMKKFADNPKKQILFRNQVFVMMDSPPGSGEGRLYDYIRFLIRDFNSVQSKLDYVTKPDNQNGTSSKPVGNGNPLQDIIGTEGLQPQEIVPLNSKVNVNDDDNRQIYDAINDADAEHRDNKDSQAIYNSAKKALRALSGLVVDQNTSKKEEAIATLNKVIEVSKELIDDINE